ncbi:MAG: hypothetical protein J6Y45_05690 [Bacteroidales bacterium]|nr:hypothetical protein [Bacteroidales bacterium]
MMYHGSILSVSCLLIGLLVVKCDKNNGRYEDSERRPIEIEVSNNNFVINENAFSVRCLQELFIKTGGENMFVSPLSIQYALAMALNGSSGETAAEIIDVLGYGNDIDDVNSIMTSIREYLLSIDNDVELTTANAMLVKKRYTVNPKFCHTLNTVYFAPVEYVDEDIEIVAERINEWSSKMTNGFISQLVDKNDIPVDFAAVLLNALCLRAKWSRCGGFAMFDPELTLVSQPFFLEDNIGILVDYLVTTQYFRYAKRTGYQAVEIPYANGRLAMYVLLPEEKGIGLDVFLQSLSAGEWGRLLGQMKEGPEVHLKMPKFEIDKSYELRYVLDAMGIRNAFSPTEALFDKMFDDQNYSQFYLSNILQHSRINLSEWGTEAAAVTAECVVTDTMIEPENKVYFNLTRPFVFLIADKSSDLILFEGVFTGKSI